MLKERRYKVISKDNKTIAELTDLLRIITIIIN